MNTKWLALPFVLLMAVPFARLALSALKDARESKGMATVPERADSAAPMENVAALVGQVGADGLSVWVLETHNPPPPPDLGESAMRRAHGSGWFNSVATVATRNRNPLNIKLGLNTRRYVEGGQAMISDISPLDGGHFLKFDCPETGFRAAVALLTGTSYRDLNLEGVFRRWSNNGFGAEILARTPLDARATIRQLRPADLKLLLGAMAAAEGYQSSTIDAEIASAMEP